MATQYSHNTHHEKHLKPIYWGIFSVGGTVAALALAPLILVFCLLLPFNALGTNGEQFYQNIHGFIAHPLVFFILVSLTFTLLWHGVHRFYYILHDMHIHVGNGTRWIFYGFAMVAYVMTVVVGM